MPVDVDNEGIVEVSNCVGIEVSRYETADDDPKLYRVSISFVFNSKEEIDRLRNAVNASINVGCLHIHFNDMVLTSGELN